MNIKYTPFPIKLTPRLFLTGNYYFNTYLAKGSNASAIIETGVSATVDQLIAQLETLGETPDYIIVTHPHSDHITGLEGLMERFPKAEVITGDGAKSFVEHPRALEAMIIEDSFMSERLGEFGISPGRPPVKKRPDLSQSTSVDGTLSIDLGGLSLDCFKTEGHSPGSIAVSIPDEKALLVSDCLGFHFPGKGFCPLFFTGYEPYMDTILHLKSFDPNILAPGHQGPILGADVKKAFKEAQFIAETIKTEANNGITPQQLFDRYYMDEFTLYSEKNIMNCMQLLIRRANEIT